MTSATGIPRITSHGGILAGVVDVEALMQPGELPPSLLDLIRRPSWFAKAACRGVGPAAFFPAPGESPTAARELCETCPARQPCLDYALADPDLDGWWAGTSARHRAALRREAS